MPEWSLIRSIPVLLTAVLTFCISATPSVTHAAKSASIVVDANTGKVLHGKHSDELRYPASLTKMMTLYLVFERIENGQLSYDTMITASPRAAAKPASKIGLKPGQQISVRTAVAALIVKSANDVATAVAEHIAGTEAAFARLMTGKARELGMPKTVFRNSSGLPDGQQVTTAREMITLALRLRDHFPKHYDKFNMTHFSHEGKRYRTHNAILRTFPGADGLKTGYIRASGFNIVSSVRRGKKHVVAAVFGGKTAAERNRLTKLLLTRGLAKAETKQTRKPQPFVREPQLVARPRPLASGMSYASATPQAAKPVNRQPPQRGGGESRRIEVARVRSEPVVPARADAPQDIGDLIRLIAEPALIAAATSADPLGSSAALQVQPVEQAVSTSGGYQIQVGAYASQNDAQLRLAQVKIEAGELLAGRDGLTPTVESGSRLLYRARFTGFEAKEATRACETLRAQGIDCLVAKGS